MSTDTQELLAVCEQLPEAARAEVADFARFLLAKAEALLPREVTDGAAERWFASTRGVAIAGVTTEQVMAMTRGEE